MTLTSLLAWAKRNERHLSTLFFLGGFVGDIIAFTLLEVGVVNIIFAAYLVAAATAILVLHFLSSRQVERWGMITRTLTVLLPLFIQYAVGAILSGSLIFYTKSAALLVSWPFLLLVAIVFFGNEVFRNYRDHLAFQTLLFFFGFYAYSIFALPLFMGALGPWIFLFSTAVAVGVFLLFLFVLYKVGQKRVRRAFKQMLAGIAGIVIAMNALYFTGLIPPLPLGLKSVVVAHSLTRTVEGYELTIEDDRVWYEFWRPQVIHYVPGTTLYAFTAVFAPVKFSTAVVHDWERYDGERWVSTGAVSFPIAGGRSEGYRGYSMKSYPAPGKWRVSVRTASGQTIGRYGFEIRDAVTPPTVRTEVR